jgi:hypothetical protein
VPRLEGCKWDAAERWKEVHTSTGWHLVSELYGTYLTMTGTGLSLKSADGASDQLWR